MKRRQQDSPNETDLEPPAKSLGARYAELVRLRKMISRTESELGTAVTRFAASAKLVSASSQNQASDRASRSGRAQTN